jgi:hypothetical protein
VSALTGPRTVTAYPGAVPTSDTAPTPGSRPDPRPPTPGGRSHPPQPAALDPPMVPFALAGIAVWAVVGLTLLPFRHTLDSHGHSSWLAICLAGFLWGFPGLAVMIRHDRNRRRRLAQVSDSTSPSS